MILRLLNYLTKFKSIDANKYLIIFLLFFIKKNIYTNQQNIKPMNCFYEVINNIFLKNKNEYCIEKYSLPSLSRSIHWNLTSIIDNLKKLSFNSKNELLLNRLFLYGPPGNGKSTFAKTIAHETNSLLVELQSPAIINPKQGAATGNLNIIFQKIYEIQQKFKRKTIIFFDEADALCNSKIKVQNNNNGTAVQTLWLWLDKIKENSNYFVILATNNIDNIHPTLLDRFGDNIILLSNPDEAMRQELIEFFCSKFDINLAYVDLCFLIANTEGLSIRAIEDIFKTTKNDLKNQDYQCTYWFINEKLHNHKLRLKTKNAKVIIHGKKHFQPFFTSSLKILIIACVNYLLFKCMSNFHFKNYSQEPVIKLGNKHVNFNIYKNI